MGSRGPKPLSATVHLLRGNPGKRAIGELLDEFRPDVEIPDCPSVLWPEAKREWKRLVVELERYRLISKLDRGTLAICCQEWARWQWAERKIREANKSDPSGEAGLIEKSPSGYRMQSVYLQISVKAQERYDRLKSCFGLSPADRRRVTPGDQQMPLPLDEEAPKGGFASL